MLKRNWYWLPTGLAVEQLYVLVAGEDGQQVVRRRLHEVDLARHQRIHLGLGVGDPDPFDAIELGELAAGHAGRRLGRAAC